MQLRYNPVKGRHYNQGFRDGLKLLVLGEAHYGEDRGPEMTQYWLGKHITGEERSATWAKCEKLLACCCAAADATMSIWDRIAFANFVQVSVPERDARPRDDEWRTGTDSF